MMIRLLLIIIQKEEQIILNDFQNLDYFQTLSYEKVTRKDFNLIYIQRFISFYFTPISQFIQRMIF